MFDGKAMRVSLRGKDEKEMKQLQDQLQQLEQMNEQIQSIFPEVDIPVTNQKNIDKIREQMEEVQPEQVQRQEMPTELLQVLKSIDNRLANIEAREGVTREITGVTKRTAERRAKEQEKEKETEDEIQVISWRTEGKRFTSGLIKYKDTYYIVEKDTDEEENLLIKRKEDGKLINIVFLPDMEQETEVQKANYIKEHFPTYITE